MPIEVSHAGPVSGLEAVVVGGGIAGLAARLALLKQGMAVSTIDPAVLGGGAMGGHHHVTIWGNGFDALRALGVTGLEQAGVAILSFEHRSSADALLWRVSTDDLPGQTRQMPLTAVRDAVKATLADLDTTATPAPPRGGVWPTPHAGDYPGLFDRFFDDGERVRVWARKRDAKVPEVELTCDLLLGAGGKRDPVRAQLFDDAPVRDLGQTLFLGFLEASRPAHGPARARWWGDVPAGSTRVVGFLDDACWIDAVATDEGLFWIAAMRGPTRSLADLFGVLDRFPDPLAAAVRGSVWALDPTLELANAQLTGWPLEDVILPPRCTRGGVGLLGDAAHGVTLILGQSVAMALEDAAVLSDALSRPKVRPTPTGRRVALREALASYGRRRVARPTWVNQLSTVMPRIALADWIPMSVRHRVDAALTPAATVLGADTLNRFDPERPM